VDDDQSADDCSLIDDIKHGRRLIVFLNTRSGGQQGEAVCQQLHTFLEKKFIYDLSDGGPTTGLQQWKDEKNLCILVCGGDGSVGWVMATLDKLNFSQPYPAVGVLPLGTGNDLARTLGWGGGYNGEDLQTIINNMLSCNAVKLDRWLVHCKDEEDPTGSKTLKMNNYLSFGIDAKIALDFHTKREANPHLFKSRLVNKAWYAGFGLTNIVHHEDLEPILILEIDSKTYVLPKGIGGLIVLNLPSYGGGADLWGKPKEGEKFTPCKISDSILEVVAVRDSLHLGKIQTGLSSGIRIAQGKEIKITITVSIATQVDGEPWIQRPGTTIITHLNQARMLMNKPSKKFCLPGRT